MTDTTTTSEVQELIQQATDALQSADLYEARKLFRQAIEQEPESLEAWIGLSDAVLPYKDRREYLQRALDIDPTSTEARTRLDEVERRMEAGELLAPRPRAVTIPAETDDATSNDTTGIDVLYCYRHPERETGLLCTQCGNPICAECARSALVGQLCPDCARERRPPNYQVTKANLSAAGVIAMVFSGGLSLLILFIGGGGLLFFFLAFMFASIMSNILVRLIDRVTHAKRGKAMQIAVGVGIGLGAAPFLLIFSSLMLLIFNVALIFTTLAQLR